MVLPLPAGMRHIGVARTLAATASVAATAALLQWQTLPDGRKVARLGFQSLGAQGLRLGILVEHIAPTAQLRFYTAQTQIGADMTGQDLLALVQRNLDAGERGASARTYWSPDLGAGDVTLELVLPAGVAPAELRLAVPRLSHLLESARSSADAPISRIGGAGACHVDVSCSAGDRTESNAVARMTFVDNGGSYECTGTLLNDQASSGTPYFLSANHCISSQAVASTLTTDWFYRSASCNSNTLAPQAQTLTAGATLLYANALSDTSFMRLNASPPSGAVFAGWSSATPSVGTEVLDLHQPRGDLQKRSEGWIDGFSSCSPPVAERFSCQSASPANSNYFAVTWGRGATESGSSGSALFAGSQGSRYLIGQLAGGSSSCSASYKRDYFGRFEVAYNAALSQWLGTPQPGNSCR